MLKCKLTACELISSKIILKKQNALCVGVFQCVCQRDRSIERSKRERGNYGGRTNVQLSPCVGKLLHCLFESVCVCLSKYSRSVWLLSSLTCIPFLSPAAAFLTLSISLLNPSLPHSAPASRSHLSSSSSHSVHSALQISPPTHMRAHTYVCTNTHAHSQREVLSGSAGCVVLPILSLYLLLYLFLLSILYANFLYVHILYLTSAQQLKYITKYCEKNNDDEVCIVAYCHSVCISVCGYETSDN